ncbi:MAG TPA: ATP-dependent 6-phosphofructokinase [Bacteroidetes bacterium]|nr:ATP-dependent 6-phosphofructokinase [Bacteroidota bacterium]
MQVKRIGILTGGGDAPGLNAVIRAATKAAILEHGWEVVGIYDSFDGLIHPEKTTPLTLDNVRGLLPRGGTVLGTTNRANPFHYPVEKNGKIEFVDMSERVLENLQNLKIDVLIVIGGDGTLSIARDFIRKGAKIVGIPKTIDNDISATDICFGFNTAVTTATEAIDKLHTTAESHHRVMVLEVMGRYAGWIALEAGIAGGSDVILIPEIPFDYEVVCDKIRQRSSQGIKFSIVVVAEGAHPRGGQMVFQDEKGDGEKRLGGIGEQVAREISQRLDLETRVTVLGHLQRGGSPSTFDRILGTRFGVAAVQLIHHDELGRMVCLRGRTVQSVEIEKAVGEIKRVDPEGEMVLTAETLGISLGRWH